MERDKIVQAVNDMLAGEMLTYDALKVHLDAVIDDINTSLCAKFPSFTEFTQAYESFPNYNFIPDKYIRSVVVVGAAFKFFITDEEGIATAQQYGYTYQNNLFTMTRDYIDYVPEEFQEESTGGIASPKILY